MDLDVSQITIPRDGVSVFVMRMPHRISAEVAERVRRYWDEAWAGAPAKPSLIILDGGIEISGLTDHQIRSCGLVRIPEGTPT